MNAHPLTSVLQRRRLLPLALVALAYLLAARFGLSLAFATQQVTAVWPPTGIAIASLTLFGARVWPALFFGAFAANAVVGETLLTAFGIALGNTAGPLLAVWLLRRFARFQADLATVRDVFSLVVLGAALSMTVTATNGVAQLALAGIVPWSSYGSVWGLWWVGDAMGVLLFAPFFLTLLARHSPYGRWLERALLIAGSFAAASIAFSADGVFSYTTSNYHLQYAVFPFIIWAALRFGPRETSQVVLLVSCVAIEATVHDRGPFGARTLQLDERLALLEMFMAVVTITGLTIAAVTAERSAAETALRAASDARFRTLFDGSPLSLWEEDFSSVREYVNDLGAVGAGQLEGYFRLHPEAVVEAAKRVRVLAVNQATLDLYGAANEAEFLKTLPATFGPEALATFAQELCALADGKTHFEAETVTIAASGRRNAVGVRLHVIPGYEKSWARVAVSLFDLTAYKESEHRLRESLREKNVLLSEVHHRVKNNLQIVSSLLNLQGSNLEQPQARRAFAEARSRIQSIALVHEKLYQSPNLSHVSFTDYTSELLNALNHAQAGSTRGIALELRGDAVELNTDVAITCGLILNELVTNALKYAFPEGRRGAIVVEIRQTAPNTIALSVRDDGVGLPHEVDTKAPASVGLSLVTALASQLDAELAVKRDPGTEFRLDFQVEPSQSQRLQQLVAESAA